MGKRWVRAGLLLKVLVALSVPLLGSGLVSSAVADNATCALLDLVSVACVSATCFVASVELHGRFSYIWRRERLAGWFRGPRLSLDLT